MELPDGNSIIILCLKGYVVSSKTTWLYIRANYVVLRRQLLQRDYSHSTSRECSRRNSARCLRPKTTAWRSRGSSCLPRPATTRASPAGSNAQKLKPLLLLQRGVLPGKRVASQPGRAMLHRG